MKSFRTVALKISKVVGVFALALVAFVCGTVSAGLIRDGEKPTTENSLIVESGQSHGISMMSADGTQYVTGNLGESAPYGALQVTATVTPSGASNQNLNWSLAWTSSKSDAVSNYLKLTTSGTNAHTAYVWALQPFDTPITVTATSTDGTSKSATMTVHFAKRMTGVTGISNFVGTFDYSGGVWQESLGDGRYSEIYIEEISFTPTYSAGSKSLTWELIDYRIVFDDALTQALTNALGKTCRTEWAYSDGDGYECHVYNMWTESNMTALFGGSNATANRNTLVDCIVENGRKLGYLYLDFESAETDAFGKKYTYTATFEAVVSSSSLGMMVESVSLSDQTLTL